MPLRPPVFGWFYCTDSPLLETEANLPPMLRAEPLSPEVQLSL